MFNINTISNAIRNNHITMFGAMRDMTNIVELELYPGTTKTDLIGQLLYSQLRTNWYHFGDVWYSDNIAVALAKTWVLPSFALWPSTAKTFAQILAVLVEDAAEHEPVVTQFIGDDTERVERWAAVDLIELVDTKKLMAFLEETIAP